MSAPENTPAPTGVRAAWARRWQRLRTEARDALELVLLPGLAAMLPWPWCFALFKRLARLRWLYGPVCERALAQAQQRGMAADPAHWLWQRRLVTLVDHADYYLGRFRGDGWLRRHVQVQGQWPAPDRPGMLCTFHWGAGMWGLRHARQSGLHAHALVASLNSQAFQGRTVLGWYARARTREVARALGRPTLDVSASLRPAVRALRANEQVLAAVDVPADQVAASEPLQLCGMRARAPRGLLRLAAEQGVPVTIYITGLDMRSGQRFLRIEPLPPESDTPALIIQTFSRLQDLLYEDPAAWHFWSEAERFFER